MIVGDHPDRTWLDAINAEMSAAFKKLERDHWRRVYHSDACPGCDLEDCISGTNARDSAEPSFVATVVVPMSNPNAETEKSNLAILATMNRVQRRAFQSELDASGNHKAAFARAMERGWRHGPGPKLKPVPDPTPEELAADAEMLAQGAAAKAERDARTRKLLTWNPADYKPVEQ